MIHFIFLYICEQKKIHLPATWLGKLHTLDSMLTKIPPLKAFQTAYRNNMKKEHTVVYFDTGIVIFVWQASFSVSDIANPQ